MTSFVDIISKAKIFFFQSFVLEVVGTNVSTTYITCPADPRKTLGIKLPYLVMIVKNMKKYFTFEVQVRYNLANQTDISPQLSSLSSVFNY